MLRDLNDNTYRLFHGGNFDPDSELKFDKEYHYCPIFFARNNDEIRNN